MTKELAAVESLHGNTKGENIFVQLLNVCYIIKNDKI